MQSVKEMLNICSRVVLTGERFGLYSQVRPENAIGEKQYNSQVVDKSSVFSEQQGFSDLFESSRKGLYMA